MNTSPSLYQKTGKIKETAKKKTLQKDLHKSLSFICSNTKLKTLVNPRGTSRKIII
ncbi:MAG TPA: hypothetical protein PLE91_06295 [Methanothermobacter sp.]|nr:hypothetical protein [Methanothermobacter sp.]